MAQVSLSGDEKALKVIAGRAAQNHEQANTTESYPFAGDPAAHELHLSEATMKTKMNPHVLLAALLG